MEVGILTFISLKMPSGASKINNEIIKATKKYYDVRVWVPPSLILAQMETLEDIESFLKNLDDLDPVASSHYDSLLRLCTKRVPLWLRSFPLAVETICSRYFPSIKVDAVLNLMAQNPASIISSRRVFRSFRQMHCYLHDYIYLNKPSFSPFYPYPAARFMLPDVKEIAKSLLPGPPYYTVKSKWGKISTLLVHALSHSILKKTLKSCSTVLLPSLGALEVFDLFAKIANIKPIIPCGFPEVNLSEKNEVSFEEFILLPTSVVTVPKGIVDALLIWKRFNLDKTLVITGKFPSRTFETQIKKLVKDLHLEEKVIFTGVLEKSVFSKLITRADTIIFPSYYDNCPQVLLEGAIYGIPIVFYDYPPVVRSVEAFNNWLQSSLGFKVTTMRSAQLGNYIDMGFKLLQVLEQGPQKVPDGLAYRVEHLAKDALTKTVLELLKNESSRK